MRIEGTTPDKKIESKAVVGYSIQAISLFKEERLMKKIYLLAVIVSALFLQAINAQEKIVNVSNTQEPAKRAYLVVPGDKIEGKVLGEDQFNFTTTIAEDGYFEVPFVEEPILAKCRSERELREEVKKHLSKYLRRPLVNVQVTERRKPAPVIVAGEVRRPGRIELTRETRLLELISDSQGATEDAGGIVRVFRSKPSLCADDEKIAQWNEESEYGKITPSRLYTMSSIIKAGVESNPVIYSGDIILVEKAYPVYINGEVSQKQGIYIKEGGLSLSQAIAQVGGTREKAQLKQVKIYRKVANSRDRQVIIANLIAIRDKKEKDVMLEPYDIVDVAKKKKSIAQVVLEVVGAAGRQAATQATTGGVRVLY